MTAETYQHFEAIEECYDFMLAYAAQGLMSDEGSKSGRQVREFLIRAVEKLDGLADSCAAGLQEASVGKGARPPAFLAVLDRDARDSLAATEGVLVQPVMSEILRSPTSCEQLAAGTLVASR
jgi:heme oxygenase